MERPRLSVILITLDEEARLGAALESVAWADEIVIVDSGSTDGTESIARRYGARFEVRDWPGYGAQKQRALELATGAWVLSLDADEAVTPALRRSIEAALADPAAAVGYTVERHSRYLGHWFGRSGWRRDRVLRLFRRERARFDGAPIHEHVVVEGPVGRLDGALLHYTYHDIAHHIAKMNGYTTALARRRYERGERSGAVRPLLKAAGNFLAAYIFKGGFLDGRAGLLSAGLGGVYSFLTYAKLWELSAARDGERNAP
jgi:glycosyltransferase involved in cell wall biosynthesis